ncbi:hypothetical protein [Lacimicrobium sp. SS2-24]|uniref:hypothetical protein n=1 Tax=Lacimicrobium sp. SS2-24 TaxID=2005569 RepID=UPI000B4B2D5C|nr:hypothetical protein [Lacimicrobium sp. SS2-24]
MKTYWGALVLVVMANAAFHIVQKSIPMQVHPLLSVMVTYTTGFIVCLLLLLLFPLTAPLSTEFSKLNWTSVALGVSIVGMEVGYLLMYRSGWPVSIGPIFTYALLTMLLVPIGLLLFKEKLAVQNYLGLFITLIGVYLLTWKSS